MKTNGHHRCGTWILAAALGLAMAPLALASRAPDVNGQTASVIDHLQLPASPVTHMFLRTGQNGRQYLYVSQQSRGVTVVDVTHPSRARIVQHLNLQAGGQWQMVGSDLALSASPQTPAQPPAPRSVSLMDFTSARNPTVLRTFTGVTSVVPDNARNLLFLVNNQGLWIVRDTQTQNGYARLHECTSESSMISLPECY